MKIARLFTPYGPYLAMNENFAIGNFVLDVIKDREICIKSDGTAYRSYLYLADVALWLVTILLNGKNGASYNVGSEHPISIVDLAKMIKRIYGSKKIIRIEKTIKKQSKPSFYIPSTLIAQKTLNLQEHFPFEEGVKKTIRYAELIYL